MPLVVGGRAPVAIGGGFARVGCVPPGRVRPVYGGFPWLGLLVAVLGCGAVHRAVVACLLGVLLQYVGRLVALVPGCRPHLGGVVPGGRLAVGGPGPGSVEAPGVSHCLLVWCPLRCRWY